MLIESWEASYERSIIFEGTAPPRTTRTCGPSATEVEMQDRNTGKWSKLPTKTYPHCRENVFVSPFPFPKSENTCLAAVNASCIGVESS